MICRVDFWSLPDWQAIAAMGTWAAAFIVLWYTLETSWLRSTAQDQLEASISPFLTIARRSSVYSSRAIELNRSGGDTFYALTIYNDGKGPALHPILRFTTKPHQTVQHPDLAMTPHAGQEVLVPLGADSRMDLYLRLESVFGGRVEDKLKLYEIELELEYQSTSGRKYRTRVRGNADTLDLTDLRYEQVREGKR